ncbi:MAG: hypothetical protein EP305_04435 [Bacteroidetes bacterium]|nr:MAG: hypothetical protein EP305_04435 [Bacteroidota bacterium]
MAKAKQQNKNDFERLHPMGFRGLFKVYGGASFLWKPSFILAFILSLVVFFISFLGGFDSNEVLDQIASVIDIGMSLDGGLIGLTLAGLTLIVTFGSERLLKHMVKLNITEAFVKKEAPGFSSYQTAVAKFGFAVFIQVITLIILFGYSIGLRFSFSCPDQETNLLINSIYLSIAVFLILYSLFLVVQMTINIFTISQMNHGVYFSDSIKEVLDENPVNESSETDQAGQD